MEAGIRLAELSDAEAISEIYNHYVRHSTCTFHLEPESVQDRIEWLRDHDERYPVTVFCEGESSRNGAAVIGWASLTRWHPRPAYRYSAELSIYIDHRHHRRGIGRRLMQDLVERAKTLGFHVLIGGVCTEQLASIRLHESMGFTEVARYRETGRKFGRWLDVAYFQMILPGGAADVPGSAADAIDPPEE